MCHTFSRPVNDEKITHIHSFSKPVKWVDVSSPLCSSMMAQNSLYSTHPSASTSAFFVTNSNTQRGIGRLAFSIWEILAWLRLDKCCCCCCCEAPASRSVGREVSKTLRQDRGILNFFMVQPLQGPWPPLYSSKIGFQTRSKSSWVNWGPANSEVVWEDSDADSTGWSQIW